MTKDLDQHGVWASSSYKSYVDLAFAFFFTLHSLRDEHLQHRGFQQLLLHLDDSTAHSGSNDSPDRFSTLASSVFPSDKKVAPSIDFFSTWTEKNFVEDQPEVMAPKEFEIDSLYPVIHQLPNTIQLADKSLVSPHRRIKLFHVILTFSPSASVGQSPRPTSRLFILSLAESGRSFLRILPFTCMNARYLREHTFVLPRFENRNPHFFHH
jgi:hypothetical protein